MQPKIYKLVRRTKAYSNYRDYLTKRARQFCKHLTLVCIDIKPAVKETLEANSIEESI